MTASVGCRLPATGGLPQAPRGGFQVSQAHNCPLKRAARRSAAPKIRTSSGLVRISPCGLGRGAQRNSWSCAGARASGRQRFGWRAGRASDAKMAILEAGRSRGRRRLVSAVRAPLGGARHGQRLVLVFNGARPGTGVRDQASPGRLGGSWFLVGPPCSWFGGLAGDSERARCLRGGDPAGGAGAVAEGHRPPPHCRGVSLDVSRHLGEWLLQREQRNRLCFPGQSGERRGGSGGDLTNAKWRGAPGRRPARRGSPWVAGVASPSSLFGILLLWRSYAGTGW